MEEKYLQKYANLKEKYETLFKGSIQIPVIHIFKHNVDNQIYSFQIWFGLPCVFPVTDYVQVGKVTSAVITKIHYIKEKREYRFLPYADFMAEFGDLFERYDKDIPDCKILLSDKTTNITARINKLFESENYRDIPHNYLKD